MITVSDCINKLITQARTKPVPLRSQQTPLLHAKDKVLSEDIYAEIDVPPADNSAMDGYAFCSADAAKGATLNVSQRVTAGHAPTPLLAGTAARIFTGAEIPAGADTVEMQENCSAENGKVTLNELIKPGANIRKKGQDITKGHVVLKKGTRLRAQELGLLASIGIDSVATFCALRVAILNTGDELIEPGQPLPPGKIYNSNRFLVDAILRGWGFETLHCAISEDNLESTKTQLKELANTADIIISTGGVSVGEEDHIKPAVEALGSLNLWKVAIKPGKPFAFGNVDNVPFLGLPGNPASVFATLLVLARPYLLSQQGLVDEFLYAGWHTAKAAFSRKAGKREEYLRAKLKGDAVEIYQNQSSGMLSSACWGDCFVVQEKGEAIQQGDDVRIVPYASLYDI